MTAPVRVAPVALCVLLLMLAGPTLAVPQEARPSRGGTADSAQIVIDQTMNVTVHLAGFSERASAVSPSVVTQYSRSANGTDENGTKSGYPTDLKLLLDFDEMSSSSFSRLTDLVNSTAQTKKLEGKLNFSQVVKMRDQKLRLDSFDELNGSEIRKESLASFFQNETPPQPGDTIEIFLLNLSYLDRRPGSPKHWIYEPVMNMDSGRENDWFRLEWDNAMNTPVAFPSESGVSARRLFIDPSAFIWYLDWTNIWWQKSNGSAPYGLRYDDVAPAQRPAYLGGIINEYIDGLLTVLPRTPLHRKAEVATFLLDDSQRFTIDELKWTASQPKVMDYLRRFTPYLSWTDTLVATDVSAYPGLEKALRENTTIDPVTGYKRIDGNKVHNYIASHKSEFITPKQDTLTLITVCLFFENGAMFTQGNEFTGLGGGGVSSIYMNTSRLFYPNTLDRKMGISFVIVHETGHNLGYPHPSYRADLVADVMGYYHDPDELSVFWEDSYHKVRIKILAEILNQRLQGISDPRVDDLIQVFYGDYRVLRYVAAYYDLLAIRALLDGNYAVYGDVVDDGGSPLALRDVTVENRRTGMKSIARTDSRGFYFTDSGSATGGVLPGDPMRATIADGVQTSFKEAAADSTMGLRIDLSVWYAPPNAPTGLVANEAPGKISLLWTQPVGGGLPLRENSIYRSATPSDLVRIATISMGTSYEDSGLPDDTTFHYAVSAINELGEGPQSAVATARTPPPVPVAPSAPRNLSYDPGPSWVALFWQPPEDPGDSPIAGYTVHRKVLNGAFEIAGTTSIARFNDTALAPGTYFYKVQAVNTRGNIGPNSTEVAVEIDAPATEPTPSVAEPSWPQLGLVVGLVVALSASVAAIAVRRRRSRKP